MRVWAIIRSTARLQFRRHIKIVVIEKITLRVEDRQAMVDHVRSAWPEEACGLLAGTGSQVKRVYLIENIRHSPNDYFMDPNQQVRTMLEIEAAGWDLCSIFHSHPAGPPQPSRTDIDRAYYPDAVYIILAPLDGQEWTMRGFEINADQVRDVAIEISA